LTPKNEQRYAALVREEGKYRFIEMGGCRRGIIQEHPLKEEKMKKLVLAACVSFMVLSLASLSIAQPYGTAGCGLGSVLFGSQPGGVQIFAATTNGTFGNQTFGITTGTLNCGDPIWEIGSTDMKQLKQFVAQNMDPLASDIAQGQGETLDAFAELLQIPASERAQFASTLQLSFEQLFTSENVVMAEVIDNAITLTN
jgi:hypothetical protein